MSILHALTRFYDRLDRRGQRNNLAIVPPPGLKFAEIDFVLEIDRDGRPLALKSKIPANGRRGPKLMVPGTAFNPKPAKGEQVWDDLSFRNRTSGRRSYLFWDKSSYVFGVRAKKDARPVEAEVTKKSREDFDSFAAAHRHLLANQTDPDFLSLLRFLDAWSPDQWEASGFPVEALDKNIAFQVTGVHGRVDEKSEARALARDIVAAKTEPRPCMLSDEVRPYAAAHPQFRGVRGAQSSGASLVSFNWDAFESYCQEKAETSPVSEEAAFTYGAALSWLLDRANSRAFRLGETTVVFWADEKSTAEGEAQAVAIEDELADLFGTSADGPVESGNADEDIEEPDDENEPDIDAEQEQVMVQQADDVRTQRAAPDIGTLDPNTRLHVLGLSPNAGRIAVRFWLVDSWGHISRNIESYHTGMRIEPKDNSSDRKPYALLYETAVQGKAENIPPRLGGELARAILSGGAYPRTLYATLIGRIRADKTINAARAGLCKAIINRDHGEEIIPVALDTDNLNPAYRLGRLFALIEGAQKAALPGIKATVKDRFFGSACATPARIFPLLHKNAMNHIAAVRKERGGGLAHWMEKEIGGVWSGLSDDLPRTLKLEEQGRFIAGYYHQRFTKAADTPAEAVDIMTKNDEDDSK
jgi:CRISPR-associated protein Csd1